MRWKTSTTAQKRRLVDKILAHFDGDIDGKTFAVWGPRVSSRARTTCARHRVAWSWRHCGARGARVRAYDPEAAESARALYPDQDGFELVDSAYEALAGADALVINTEWQEFRSPDYETLP